MKMYSKFTYYYDHATGYYSNEITWVRNTQVYNIRKGESTTPYSIESEKTFLNMISSLPYLKSNNTDLIIIGLCGRIHLAVADYNNDTLIGYYTNKVNKDIFKSWQLNRYIDWVQIYKNNSNLLYLFLEINSPVFIIKKRYDSYALSKRKYNGYNGYNWYNLIINPCLNDFKLQSSFDPFTLNQDIEQFLGNQLLTVDDPDINRSDNLIRDSKGFDKYSFRQQGPKKRRNNITIIL